MRFEIRARKKIEGAKLEKFVREEANVEALVPKLQAEGYVVLSIRNLDTTSKGWFGKLQAVGKKAQAVKKSGGLSEIVLFEKVKGYELVSFFVQIIALLRAGVPILRSLSIIEQGLKKGLLKKIVHGTIARISQGFSLSSALSAYPKVFPPFWSGLIEAGEASGNLPDVLAEIQKYQETSEKFKSKLTSAMIYPSILICFSIGAIAIFMIKVIPTFEKVFQSFGRKKGLPAITQFVLDLSRFMQSNVEWFLLAIFLVVSVYVYLNRRRATKKWLDAGKLQIPLIQNFLTEVAIVRFSRGLGTMVRAGIPIIKALEIASRIVGNVVIEDKIDLAKEEVKRGTSVAQGLERHTVFPIFVTQLIAVGEESGALEKFLEVLSNFYEERVDATIQRISVMIEPMVILFMGLVVGTLVISMFLPLIEISTGGG